MLHDISLDETSAPATNYSNDLAAVMNITLKKHTESTDKADEPALDTKFYGSYYPDLRGLSDDELRHHYRMNGRSEHRWPTSAVALRCLTERLGKLPSDFSDLDYKHLYPEINAYFGFEHGAAIHYLEFGRSEGRSYLKPSAVRYDRHLLNLLTNRIYDLPDIAVEISAPVRINVLVPAFDFRSMSAGFFGVFQVARFIQSCGFAVRLVMFDNFYWNESEFRERLLDYPGMERLFDELEIDYIGSRSRPLVVSPFDNCVATVWYSAYFADKIMSMLGNRPFLYLIQDYETNFFPGGSLFSMADESYMFNFLALFSSKTLMLDFLARGIGVFGKKEPRCMYFNNACASHLPEKDSFISKVTHVRRLAFYSRPTVNRNMFELGALALIESFRAKLFGDGNWEFYGVGIGEVVIELDEHTKLQQLPRMTLKEYQVNISSFDLGLCLMASAHPSLLPFDLAGSGAIVVTNTFGIKNKIYFDKISSNIIAKSPTLNDLVDGLTKAVALVGQRADRYQAALEMKYPRSWEESFDIRHVQFVSEIFAASGCKSKADPLARPHGQNARDAFSDTV